MKERGDKSGEEPKVSVVKIKNYFVEMPKKKRFIVIAIAIAIIALAAFITFKLNAKPPQDYQVIYAAATPEAAADLFLELKGQGAEPKLEGNDVLVKTDDYNALLIKMATTGTKKDALAYGIFSQYSGLTSTESEKKQTIIYQLQDRLQDTLKSIDGVRDAIVTLVLPKETKNVWETGINEEKATASVTLELRPNVALTPEQVSAVKNLVSSSVTKLAPADVTVVDSGTGMQLFGLTDESVSGITSGRNLGFQRDMEKHIQDKAIAILEPIVGPGGVTAQANVVLDYDTMIRESYDLQGKNAGGDGFLSHRENGVTTSGVVAPGGLVGENPNTDIPTYPYGDATQQGGVTDATNGADYVYGYIKTQVEKGQAALTSASISVVVDQELTAVQLQTFTTLIANSTGVDPQFITIAPNFIPPLPTPAPDVPVPVAPEGTVFQVPVWVWFVIGGVLLLVVVLVLILLLIRKKNKKIVQQKDAEIVDNMQSMEDEIAKYKRELENAARATSDPKDDAIMDEVRGFAKENPEITANLLRSWLKEGEE